MADWNKRLILEYKEGQKQLEKKLNALDEAVPEDKSDMKVIKAAIREMKFVIKWLETGIQPESRGKTYKAYDSKKQFVYGVNGFWDESMGGFITKNNYIDPYKEVEDRIDRERAVK